MTGAIFMAHAPHGFFMNWAGTQAGEGFEYHLLALALVAIVVVAGGGRASLDRCCRVASRARGELVFDPVSPRTTNPASDGRR